MQCPQCGAEVDSQNVFCPRCGNQLGEEAMAPEDTEPTAQDRFRQAAASRQPAGDDDQETQLWMGRYSGKAMIGVWIGAGVLSLAALIVGAVWLQTIRDFSILVGVLLLGWAALVLYYLYQRYSVHYTVTNHRFIHERGILWRTVDRVELIDVGDITFRQGPVERMLNVGTIYVTSSDPTHPNLSLPGIEDVRAVAGIIDRQRREERKRRGLHIHNV